MSNETPRQSSNKAGATKDNKNMSGRQGKSRNMKMRTTSRTYPVMPMEVTLRHDLVIKHYQSQFSSFCQAFYYTSSTLARQSLAGDLGRIVEHFEAVIEVGRADLDATKKLMDEKIRAAGFTDDIPMTTKGQQKGKAEIPAHIALLYLKIFRLADEVMDRIVCAEALGTIDWDERSRLINDTRNSLRKPAVKFRHLSQRMHELQVAGADEDKTTKGVMALELNAILAEPNGAEKAETPTQVEAVSGG